MSVFKIGGRYKLVKHPNQPIGKATGYDLPSGCVVIEWEGKLIPPVELYPENCFVDGTFIDADLARYIEMGGEPGCWNHQWTEYTGLREQYEYCKKCDMKRFKQ